MRWLNSPLPQPMTRLNMLTFTVISFWFGVASACFWGWCQ